jgi:hypothetical protein
MSNSAVYWTKRRNRENKSVALSKIYTLYKIIKIIGKSRTWGHGEKWGQ